LADGAETGLAICALNFVAERSFLLLDPQEIADSPFSFSGPFVPRLLFSVVEQEKPEKADQDPEHRAENSKPEWDVPA
jgi:hypothetical protein